MDGVIRDLCPDRVDELVRKINECDVMCIRKMNGNFEEDKFMVNTNTSSVTYQINVTGKEVKIASGVALDYGYGRKHFTFGIVKQIANSGNSTLCNNLEKALQIRLVEKSGFEITLSESESWKKSIDFDAPVTSHIFDVYVRQEPELIKHSSYEASISASIKSISATVEQRYHIEL